MQISQNTPERTKQQRMTGLWVILVAALYSQSVQASVVEFTGGPTTTITDSEVYFSPVTGQVWTSYSNNALFGIANVSGSLAIAFNTTSDGTLMAAPNSLNPSLSTVARLSTGAAIGPGSTFDNTEYTLAESDGLIGNWNQLGSGFFGFRFGTGSNIHYGWANITVLPNFNITLNRFAYESTADQPIVAVAPVPEPSSIALVGVFGILGLLFGAKQRFSRQAQRISLAVGLIVSSRVVSAQTSDLPGQTDPVGNHLMQFRNDHLFSITDNFQNNLLNTFSLQYSDNPFSVSLNNTLYSVIQPWSGIRQFHAASGRILQPDHDDVVLVNVAGPIIDVQIVGQPAAYISLPNVLPRYFRSFPDGSTQPTVDFVAVAVADLDHAVDSSGNYHDEVVIAYVTTQNTYQLAVLDYSNIVADPKTGKITAQPPKVVSVQALQGLKFDPSKMANSPSDFFVGQSGILPYDNILSVSTGDYDGDGSAEIAISAPKTPTALAVQTLRYRPEEKNIFEIGLQNITIPNIKVGTDSVQGFLAANVTTASGDYEGRSADDLAFGYLAFFPTSTEVNEPFDLAPSFVVHLLNAPTQLMPVNATLQPGNPTTVTVDGSLAGRIPQQLTISNAAALWNAVNGTWTTTLTSFSSSQVSFSLPVDTSLITANPNQTITLLLSTGLGPITGPPPLPPLQIAMNKFYFSVPDDYPKLQLVSGLFKFDPSNGWDFSRRQFAAIWNEPQNCSDPSCVSSAYKIAASWYSVSPNTQGVLQFNPEGFTEIVAPTKTQAAQRVAATAGAFRGDTILNTDGTQSRQPTWSLAVNAWYSNAQDYLYILEPNGTGFNVSSQSFPTNQVDTEERLAVVNYDADGSSIYLGAPIRLSVSNLFTPTTILEEPPKHLAWLNGSIFNLNRNDGFNVQLQASSTEQVSTSTQQQSSSDFATTDSISAGLSVKTTVFPGISNQFSVKDTAKFSYDKGHTNSSYYSSKGSLSYSSGAETDHDDLIQALTQNLTIWRYRIYSASGNNPSTPPTFYDLTYPNSPYDASVPGLTTDWYNPIHENGNVLSYPPPSNGQPDDVGSPYKVNGQTPPNLSNGILYSGKSFCFGGVSGPQTITMTGVSSSGDKVGTSKSFSWDNDTQVADTVKVVGPTINASVDADFGKKQSTSTATASSNTSTGSTSVTLNLAAGDASNTYNIFPIFYNSDAGVLKFVHYVSIPTSGSMGACTTGGKWWTDNYGGAPDPALNLPFRFSFGSYNKSSNATTWSLQTGLQREQLRGFFLTSDTTNPVESTPDNPVYTPLATNPVEGSTVRMAVRVYNFSRNKTASGVQAQFSVVPYDTGNDNELACGTPAPTETGRYCAPNVRTVLGKVNLPTIPSWGAGNNWTTAEFGWSIPQGFVAQQKSPEFRVYVNLSYPGDPKTELNPPQAPCNHALPAGSPCPSQIAVSSSDPNWDQYAPGQNNEGFSFITLQAAAPQAALQSVPPGVGSTMYNLKTTSDSLAAVDSAGNLKSGLVIAYQGRPLRLRVKAVSELGDIQEQQKTLVFDGSGPGQKMIAAKILRGVRTNGTSAWFEWTPTTLGLHQLMAEVLESQEDLKKGDNIAKLSVVVVRLPGDVNGDGSVDARDTALLSDQIGKHVSESTCGSACDLNGDGFIGKADLELAIAHCDHSYCAATPMASVPRKAASPEPSEK